MSKFISNIKQLCPGQDVKRYPKGERLDNRKVFSASDHSIKF